MKAAPIIDYSIWVPRTLRAELAALASRWHPLEVGGILAGDWNGNAAVVTEQVGPGELAVHREVDFVPDHGFHVREMERIFRSSNGQQTYLGDWHTHPDGANSLSRLDKRTLSLIAKDPAAQCPKPIMVLLAGNLGGWSLRAFTLADRVGIWPRKVVPMEVICY
jgi:integrative and conjugative element protein (TIGR02256 family)